MKKIFCTFLICLFVKFSGYAQAVTLLLRDPDTKAATNIRSKPGGEIVGTIDGREADFEVQVISKEGNYFLVKSYVSCEMDEPVTLDQPGYIHYSVLGTVISNYAKNAIPLYASSNKTGLVERARISEVFVNVLDYNKDMYYVFYKKLNKKFWIESKYLCNSACTTCN
ncbi:MAG: hypothetical protein RLZ95_256 [Bacteroidota bacterium]|jgi:hypothetical protein